MPRLLSGTAHFIYIQVYKFIKLKAMMEWNNIGGKATQALRNEKARIVRDEDFQIAFISGFV